MKPIELSESGRADFLRLVEYLHEKRATELIDAYESVLRDLRQHPEIGELEPDGRTRLLRRRGYRFYYAEAPDRLWIVRVIDPRGGLPPR